jgi:cytochrome c oxidase subunit 2
MSMPRHRPRIRPSSCASSLNSSRGTCTTRARTGVFGRTDIRLVSPDNPLGLDRDEPVGKDDLVVNGRLNLPVDRPVIVYLSSKDVIHSFALPQMRVKQDAIPGIVQPVWFTPTMTGQWDIACSQLCGLGHYRMKGVYQIQPPEEYQAWLKEEASFLSQ